MKKELKRKGKKKEEVKKKEGEKSEEQKAAVYEPFKCGICDHSTETLCTCPYSRLFCIGLLWLFSVADKLNP